MWNCLINCSLFTARRQILKHEHSFMVKSLIIRILQDYADDTSNTVDDAIVKELAKRIFEKP